MCVEVRYVKKSFIFYLTSWSLELLYTFWSSYCMFCPTLHFDEYLFIYTVYLPQYLPTYTAKESILTRVLILFLSFKIVFFFKQNEVKDKGKKSSAYNLTHFQICLFCGKHTIPSRPNYARGSPCIILATTIIRSGSCKELHWALDKTDQQCESQVQMHRLFVTCL